MRRKEKEITDHTEIEAILNRSEICRLAMADDNVPYVVALNYGYANNCLYIHCAPEGKKIDMIRKIRINQLQAAAITGMGMGKIAWDTLIIQLPFMARTDEELNYLFEKMYPHFDRLMNEKGFKLLAFTQIGWAHFFAKKPD